MEDAKGTSRDAVEHPETAPSHLTPMTDNRSHWTRSSYDFLDGTLSCTPGSWWKSELHRDCILPEALLCEPQRDDKGSCCLSVRLATVHRIWVSKLRQELVLEKPSWEAAHAAKARTGGAVCTAGTEHQRNHTLCRKPQNGVPWKQKDHLFPFLLDVYMELC